MNSGIIGQGQDELPSGILVSDDSLSMKEQSGLSESGCKDVNSKPVEQTCTDIIIGVNDLNSEPQTDSMNNSSTTQKDSAKRELPTQMDFSDDDIDLEQFRPAAESCRSPHSAVETPTDSVHSSDSESDTSSESDTELNSLLSDDNDDDDDDGEEEVNEGPILSKNEVKEEIVPSLPENYEISESLPLEYVGVITALVERNVIIRADTSGEFRTLKENSVLCFENRQVLGLLHETFGKLQSPNYRVQLNNEKQFLDMRDKKGAKVFYVVPDSLFTYTDAIRKIKGTDASNCHDEELPEEEQEFSDDERELAAKQEKKKRKKTRRSGVTEKPTARSTISLRQHDFVSYGFAEQAPRHSAGESHNQIQFQGEIRASNSHQSAQYYNLQGINAWAQHPHLAHGTFMNPAQTHAAPTYANSSNFINHAQGGWNATHTSYPSQSLQNGWNLQSALHFNQTRSIAQAPDPRHANDNKDGIPNTALHQLQQLIAAQHLASKNANSSNVDDHVNEFQ